MKWLNWPKAAIAIVLTVGMASPVNAAVYEKAGLLVPPDANIKLGDNSAIRFGNGAGGYSDASTYDVTARWDGTDLDWIPNSNNTVIKYGTGTLSFDQWWYGSSGSNYILFDASANLLNWKGSTAATFDSGALLTVAGTADLTGTFKIGGTAVTSSAAELNILDGLTASTAELNLADGATEGVAVASKLLALGADKNVDTLVIADSGLKLGSGAGTAVTSTAVELNILDGVTAASDDLEILSGAAAAGLTSANIDVLTGLTPGTSSPSSAVVLDANSAIDAMNVVTLSLGAGAGTAISATATEINTLSGIAVPVEELNLLADQPASVSFTIGAEAGDNINVAGQLRNAQNANVTGIRYMTFYLSDGAAGAITASAPNATASIGSSGSIVVTDVASSAYQIVTDANGAFDFDFGHTAGATWYPVLVLPTGKIQTGAAITFAP